MRRLVEGDEMTLLDEKIAAIFRKSSPISADAEMAPSVDRPVAEEAASEVVVNEPAAEEGSGNVADQPPPSLGTARYQSQANEINARQSR